jgi:hypothetical protein
MLVLWNTISGYFCGFKRLFVHRSGYLLPIFLIEFLADFSQGIRLDRHSKQGRLKGVWRQLHITA